jgi:hypothetical protein
VPISPVDGDIVTIDDAIKEAETRKMKMTPDMVDLLHVCPRLEGGGRDENLKPMSKALWTYPTGNYKLSDSDRHRASTAAFGFQGARSPHSDGYSNGTLSDCCRAIRACGK